MSPAATNPKLISANDADYASKVAKSSDDRQDAIGAGKLSQADSSSDNPVKQAIEQFRAFTNEIDDVREVLRAHGVPLRTTQMMVEFGVQNQLDKQVMVMDSAIEQSEGSYGKGALTRQQLDDHISTIVNLERDLTDVRTAAREKGLDVKALSILTQMVQQNPGDNGAKAFNTFLGYALAFGLKTDQLSEITDALTQRKDSVLPNIPGKAETDIENPRKKLIQEMVIGLVIGVVIISMLL